MTINLIILSKAYQTTKSDIFFEDICKSLVEPVTGFVTGSNLFTWISSLTLSKFHTHIKCVSQIIKQCLNDFLNLYF